MKQVHRETLNGKKVITNSGRNINEEWKKKSKNQKRFKRSKKKKEKKHETKDFYFLSCNREKYYFQKIKIFYKHCP